MFSHLSGEKFDAKVADFGLIGVRFGSKTGNFASSKEKPITQHFFHDRQSTLRWGERVRVLSPVVGLGGRQKRIKRHKGVPLDTLDSLTTKFTL